MAYMDWMETENIARLEYLRKEWIFLNQRHIEAGDFMDFLVGNAGRAMKEIEDAWRTWIELNKKHISPCEFLEVLLDNYTKDFTSEAARNASRLAND